MHKNFCYKSSRFSRLRVIGMLIMSIVKHRGGQTSYQKCAYKQNTIFSEYVRLDAVKDKPMIKKDIGDMCGYCPR